MFDNCIAFGVDTYTVLLCSFGCSPSIYLQPFSREHFHVRHEHESASNCTVRGSPSQSVSLRRCFTLLTTNITENRYASFVGIFMNILSSVDPMFHAGQREDITTLLLC